MSEHDPTRPQETPATREAEEEKTDQLPEVVAEQAVLRIIENPASLRSIAVAAQRYVRTASPSRGNGAMGEGGAWGCRPIPHAA